MTDERAHWDGRLRWLTRVRGTPAYRRGLGVIPDAAHCHIVARFDDVELGDAAWQAAQGDADAAARTGDDDGWIRRTCDWLDAGAASWPRSAAMCAGVVWYARNRSNSPLLYLTAAEVRAEDLRSTRGRAMLHIYLLGLRYDFRLAEITEFCRSVPGGPSGLDPFARALNTFGLLGQNKQRGLDELDQTLPAIDDDPTAYAVLLHGLWFGSRLPDQPRRILDLVDNAPATMASSPMTYQVKAHALHRLGEYDAALRCIDEGLQHIAPNAVAVHGDFMRERAMIMAMQHISALADAAAQAARQQVTVHVEQALSEIKRDVEVVRGQISNALFKSVEILGLFTAIIALLASTGAAVAIGPLTWWQRLVLILASGTTIVAFFLVLRLAVRPSR